MSPERTDESQVPLKRPKKPNSKYTSEAYENLEVLKQPKKVPVPKQKVKEDNKKKSKNDNQEDSVTESDSTDVDSSLKDLLDDRRDSSESDKSFENLKESCADDNDKENDPSTSRSFKKSGHNDKIPVGVTDDDDDCNDPDLYDKDWPGEKGRAPQISPLSTRMRASPKQTAGHPWIAKRRGKLVGLNNPLSTIFSKKQKGYCMDLASLIDYQNCDPQRGHHIQVHFLQQLFHHFYRS
ncbi:uncharacterized G-patch domain protein DDB_G0278987-like [Neodiprion pinetum]|uniref:uncharacterized G-patch domain protein DDB_G0278987-like n=1 Tax=Neodiprion pinetum TaxID=441929 RepID=UPI003710FBA9